MFPNIRIAQITKLAFFVTILPSRKLLIEKLMEKVLLGNKNIKKLRFVKFKSALRFCIIRIPTAGANQILLILRVLLREGAV